MTMSNHRWYSISFLSILILTLNLVSWMQSCKSNTSTPEWEDRPGINVEGETLEEACLIARQHISECFFEGREHDASLVFIVDWDKRCTEDTVLQLQWMPCEEVTKDFK